MALAATLKITFSRQALAVKGVELGHSSAQILEELANEDWLSAGELTERTGINGVGVLLGVLVKKSLTRSADNLSRESNQGNVRGRRATKLYKITNDGIVALKKYKISLMERLEAFTVSGEYEEIEWSRDAKLVGDASAVILYALKNRGPLTGPEMASEGRPRSVYGLAMDMVRDGLIVRKHVASSEKTGARSPGRKPEYIFEILEAGLISLDIYRMELLKKAESLSVFLSSDLQSTLREDHEPQGFR